MFSAKRMPRVTHFTGRLASASVAHLTGRSASASVAHTGRSASASVAHTGRLASATTFLTRITRMTRMGRASGVASLPSFASVRSCANAKKNHKRIAVAAASREPDRGGFFSRGDMVEKPTSGLNEPRDSPPWIHAALGLIVAAGASTAIWKSNNQKYLPVAHHSDASSRVITLRTPVEYSSLAAFPSCDVGTIGGLVPKDWGLPYDGKNPAVALAMASAGVTLRMIMNVTIIYLIKNYWVDQ